MSFKLLVRGLLKRPFFSGINMLGLGLGLMAFLFICQYVVFQWSYNDMYAENDRSYRLLEAVEGNDLTGYTVPGFVPLVKETFPG